MNRIKDLRNERGLTQDDLAMVLNVKRPAISKYESGSVPLTDSHLLTLSAFFDVTIDYILGKTTIKKAPVSIKGYEGLSEDKKLSIDSILRMTNEQARAFRNLFEQFQANQENEK